MISLFVNKMFVPLLILKFCFCLLAAELVERVVLLGAPIAIRDENWETVRKVERELILLLITMYCFY